MTVIKKLLFTLLTVLNALPAVAQFTVGQLTYTPGSGGNCSVTSAPTTVTGIAIPASVDYGGSTYTVTEIGKSAFQNCSKLTSLSFPATITTINTQAFIGCSSLTEVVLPPSVVTVGALAFSGCTNLREVYLGPDVKTLGANAFKDTGLTEVYITAQTPPSIQSTTFPAGLTVYVQGENARKKYATANHWKTFGQPSLMTLPAAISTYNAVNIYSTSPMTVEFGKERSRQYFRLPGETMTFTTSLTGSPTINKIFWTSSAPDKVSVDAAGKLTVKAISTAVPDTLTAKSMYDGGPVLKILVNGYHPEGSLYYSINTDNAGCTVVGPSDRNVQSVSIPASAVINGKTYPVTSINELSFYNCKSLTSVTLPSSVTSIGYRAFCSTAISTIVLPTSIIAIGGDAFKQTKLTAINIPNSVTSLGSYAFENCTELKSVTLSNALTAINGYTFNNCSNLESIILPPAIKTIGTYAFSNCGSLKSIYMGPNVSSIQDQAFTNDFALTDIYITAQSAPTLGANSFPGSIFQNANLHLQGDNTWTTAYKPRPNWSKFTESNVKVMPAATSMSTYNNINIFPDKPLTALAGQEAATRSLLLKAGKSAKYNTSLGADSGKTLEQTGIFWTSSDTDKIYIDNSGLITMKVIPTSPVTLEAISIYAGSPAIQITVGGGYSYVEGNNEPLYFSVLDEEAATCTVTAPENADLTTAVIPKKVIINDKEYTVTAVSDLAFFQCKSLTSVTIPNTITKLGYKAFCETALKQVTIPTSMTIISGDAFKATPLTSVVIPNSVTSIGSYAFDRCRQLETVTLGNGISIINGYTFFECSSLTSIVIPPSVKTVEACAFRNCVKLKTVYMGSKITKIGTQAFYGDEAITDIYITAAKAPSITDNSFATSVFENATLHLQGNGTESVYRTNSIWGNFKKAAVLLTPPTEMSTYNGINVFATSPLKAEAGKQPATTSLLLASGKTAKYYTSLTHDTGSLNETEILALSKVYWKTSSPANVYVDFNGNLTVVSAPVSPVKVTAETMYADSPVIEITVRGSYPVEGENLYFTILSEEDATCAVATTVNSGIETAVIPEKVTIKGKEYTVTAISDLAFYQCTKLTSVTIPNTVTKFGYKAFCQTGLEQVTIPASVTSIGGDAFKESKLTSVTIPNSVTAIGSWAFDRCANLKSVTLGNGITAIQGYTFSYCAALETIIIPPSVKTIESYAFRDCTALTAVYMGPNITRIATNAFGATPKLTDIYITAQNVPTLYESSFPSNVFENVTLHLQGGDTEGNYRKNAVWNKFKKAAVVMPLPVSLSTVNGDDIHPTNPLTAEFGKTATHSFLLKPQGKVTYTTTLVAESQDTPLDVRNIFWKSTSADKVYVDFNGKITSNGILDAPVTITGESIYANGPVLQITITGCLLSDSSDGPLYYSVISEDMATCSVVASDEGIVTVDIPENVTISGKEYTVTAIGDLAFYRRKTLTKVSIPNTVTSIGYRSFYGAGLTELTLPTSLTTITGASFEQNQFKKVVIPNSVTTFGSYSFNGCTQLEEIELSHATQAIGQYTFQNCKALKSIVLPPAVKTIGVNAFNGCSKLESIYMGPNITEIRDDAFKGCGALKDVYITAQKAPTLSASAFPEAVSTNAVLHLQGDATPNVYTAKANWNKFLTKDAVTMIPPESLSTYNNDDLYSNNPLRVNSGATGTHSFLLRQGGSVTYTTSLQFEVENPDVNRVFWTSSAPDKVYVDSNGRIINNAILEVPVTITGRSLYANGPVLQITITGCYPYSYENQVLYYTVTSEDESTCAVSSSDKDITYAPIPETAVINDKEYIVTAIDRLAFYQCKSLTSVSIPTTVTSIGYRSFYGAGLTELMIPTSVTRIYGAALEWTPLKRVEIPNSVVNFEGYVLSNCKQLEEVVLSHSTRTIGQYAFQNCTSLKSIVLPPSVTSIEQYAFYGCRNLEAVYIGPKVTSIKNNAFLNATALSAIYITSQKAPTITSNTFPESVLANATLYLQGEDTKKVYKAHSLWGNFKKEAAIMVEPTYMELYNGLAPSEAPVQVRAVSAYNSAEHIYGNAGETHQRSASLTNENGQEVTIPNIFWNSSDPDKVYVDHNGLITLNKDLELNKPVTVTAESLYANVSPRTVTIDNEVMTGLEEIFTDEPIGDSDTDAPAQIFTPAGLPAGHSVKDLAPGIYIVRQGKQTVKITVR